MNMKSIRLGGSPACKVLIHTYNFQCLSSKLFFIAGNSKIFARLQTMSTGLGLAVSLICLVVTSDTLVFIRPTALELLGTHKRHQLDNRRPIVGRMMLIHASGNPAHPRVSDTLTGSSW